MIRTLVMYCLEVSMIIDMGMLDIFRQGIINEMRMLVGNGTVVGDPLNFISFLIIIGLIYLNKKLCFWFINFDFDFDFKLYF